MEKELKEVLTAFKWTFENMGESHNPDHFNIPSNGIRLLEDVINQFTPKKESKTIEERHSTFFDCVHSVIMRDNLDIPKEQIQEFISYWTEISPNAKKMRFEKEKVFDIKKRLERWSKNQKTFNNGKQTRVAKFESAFNRADENSGTVETLD